MPRCRSGTARCAPSRSPRCPPGTATPADPPATGALHPLRQPGPDTYAFVADDAGRLLALRRAHPPCVGEWDLPGGFVEAGEEPREAILREIAEETGLEVELLGILGAYTSVYGDTGRRTVDLAYRARVTGGTLTLSDEKSEAAWFAPAEFPEPAFRRRARGLADLTALGPWTSA